MNKKNTIFLCFLTICLVATFFIGATTSQQPLEYNPWYDLTQDGAINIFDLRRLAKYYNLEGNPINTTALLLDLNATVAALETRVSRSGNISIPAAAFTPGRTDKDWRNGGYRLDNFETADLYSYWYAQVQLPHGANITNVTTYWFDNNASHCVHCTLERYNQTHLETVAYVVPPIEYMAGWGSRQAPSIIHPTVDNNKYAYFLDVILPSPSSDFYFQYAVIEYEYQ